MIYLANNTKKPQTAFPSTTCEGSIFEIIHELIWILGFPWKWVSEQRSWLKYGCLIFFKGSPVNNTFWKKTLKNRAIPHNLSLNLELRTRICCLLTCTFVFHTLCSQTSLSWSWLRVRPAASLRRNLCLHSSVFKPLENVKEHYIGSKLYSVESKPVGTLLTVA